MQLQIQHDQEAKQFFADIDGNIAKLDYFIEPDGKTLDYHHTFVPEALRGQQIGDKIVKFALDYAKENNFKVIPSCPFVKTMIERYPEYKDIAVEM
jgi:predicted GNAT family acetyltransferase